MTEIINNNLLLFNSILNDKQNYNNNDNNNKLCLILNEPLEPTHIKLPCNHSFNYLPLIKHLIKYYEVNRYINCPYCRTFINGVIPYNPMIYKYKIRFINWTPDSCIFNHKCSHDENCHINATVFLNDKYYCYKHYRKHIEIDKNNKKNIYDKNKFCSIILKSGKNKGNPCGCKTILNEDYCLRHKPKT